ncbi:hypothetical protein BDF19DRAFT_58982 [Syncephalis fuscata]|nr:hypothetical protein BDF19DRAFT_58982 [Syncephalis fuscata]
MITPKPRLTPSITADKQICADISQRIKDVLASKSPLPTRATTPYFDRLHARDTNLDDQVEKLRRDKEPHPSNIPTLDDIMQKKVKWALQEAKGSIVDKFNMVIGCNDIRTLRDKQWLNDEVINFYTQLLMERAANDEKRPKIHCYNTFFYSTLADSGYARIRRWTKRVDIFSKDFLIIPVHLGVHWCCAIINFRKKRIEYYDSLFGSNRRCFTLLRDYLEQESLDKKKCSFDQSGWQDYEAKDIPGQANGYDCGYLPAHLPNTQAVQNHLILVKKT